MKNSRCFFIIFFLCGWMPEVQCQQADTAKMHIAQPPLFRDPIYDGAADPVMVYNKQQKEWWMFYTQRRANVQSPM